MVYTKHLPVHSFNYLQKSISYIRNPGKTKINHLENVMEYIQQDYKTEEARLVSGHLVADTSNAFEEFAATKIESAELSGKFLRYDKNGEPLPITLESLEKGNKNGNSILAHHLIQSFDPEDNLTPEQIHEIGRQTVEQLTGGEYQYVIATHIDKGHLHNHIVFNSTNSLTGKSFRWQKGTKHQYAEISDKIASRYGAKIIKTSLQNSHDKYSKWQVNSLYKNKIKQRLDYLISHSNSIDDFMLKAKALNLLVDGGQKHTRFKLLDTDQQQMTRARVLDKKNTEKYQLDSIKKAVDNNDIQTTIEEVIENYHDEELKYEQDFEWQIPILDWQIDSKDSCGLYVNIDFGVANHGQVYVYANKVDMESDGSATLYIKDTDYFHFVNDDGKPDKSRYLKGKDLVQQLSRYNGQKPLRKEPIMAKVSDYVKALEFYVEHGNGELTSGQGQAIEHNIESALSEATSKLAQLDSKIIELKQAHARLIINQPEGRHQSLKDEIEAFTVSRDLLHKQYEQAVNDLDYYRGVHAKVTSVYEPQKEDEKTRGPQL